MPTILPIFDVDGTLTHTTGVDDESFVHAVEQVLGCTVLDRDWANYTHSTDQGLTHEIAQRSLGRTPTHDEFERVRTRFFENLREKIGASPSRCRAAPGVVALLAALRGGRRGEGAGDGGASAEHAPRFSIASGAWPGSAKIKLDAAGLNVHDVPSCFSTSHPAPDGSPLMREEIIQTSARRWLERTGARAADLRVVYIGDGVWDARASKALGIGFLGVRLDGRTDRLRAESPDAPIVLNYLDLPSVLSLLPALARPIRL
jgi:phosphoglycolate phosphatase-like HAD superfamily hydrolase